MTDDLITRLRGYAACRDIDAYASCDEAADALETQARRIADLRKEADMMHSEYKTAITYINDLKAALKPFANVAEEVNADRLCYRDIEIWVAVADLRAARAALEK
jgi:hypothetical protein